MQSPGLSLKSQHSGDGQEDQKFKVMRACLKEKRNKQAPVLPEQRSGRKTNAQHVQGQGLTPSTGKQDGRKREEREGGRDTMQMSAAEEMDVQVQNRPCPVLSSTNHLHFWNLRFLICETGITGVISSIGSKDPRAPHRLN